MPTQDNIRQADAQHSQPDAFHRCQESVEHAAVLYVILQLFQFLSFPFDVHCVVLESAVFLLPNRVNLDDNLMPLSKF